MQKRKFDGNVRHAARQFVAAALTMSGLVAAGYVSDVPAAAQTGVSSPSRAAAKAPAARKIDPQDAWAAARPRVERALRESESAINARIAKLDEFFAERKEGARPFAESVLSLEGKARASSALAETVLGGLNEALGGKPVTGPDSFTIYVRQRFRQQVLDPAKVKQAVEDAVSGYLGDAAEIEARLLVSLKADIDDSALDLRGSLPDLRAEAAAGEQYDAVVGETLDAAAMDLVVSLGMYVVSNYISDKVTDRLAPDGTRRDVKSVGNFILGMFVVDPILGKVAEGAGYDPEGDVTAKTMAGLDRIRALVVGGDPDAVKLYTALFNYREGHPDGAVRDACRQAIEALEHSANLGLRIRLASLHNERCRRLTTALIAHIFGPEAARTPVRLLPPLDPKTVPAPKALIGWAKRVTTAYGGTR